MLISQAYAKAYAKEVNPSSALCYAEAVGSRPTRTILKIGYSKFKNQKPNFNQLSQHAESWSKQSLLMQKTYLKQQQAPLAQFGRAFGF